MDFGFSDEQEMLRQTAHSFLEENCPSTVVRQLMEDDTGYDANLWKQMADLGWLGLAFPEAYGGQGLGFVDLTVILEEMGAALLPSPFLSSILLAGQTILLGGSEEQKQTYLPNIADGSLIATLAMTEPSGRFDAEGIAEVKATPEADGFRLCRPGDSRHVTQIDPANLARNGLWQFRHVDDLSGVLVGSGDRLDVVLDLDGELL